MPIITPLTLVQPAVPFNPDSTIGALEIGALVSIFLFGLVTVQTYTYTYRFPKDPKLLRVLVPFVWLLEFGHTVCICHALYTITVSEYGKFWLLEIPPQSLNVAILFSGFVGPIEQGWFALRIYKFSNKMLLPLFCLFLAVVRFIGSITLSVIAFHRLPLMEYTLHWTWLLTSILVIGAATDVILATSLCYHLSKWRGAGFERTTRLIGRLMIWSIETGLLTSIAAVALLVCFLTMPNNFVWIGIFSILARLFSNSFLGSLNARPNLARIYEEDVIRLSPTSGAVSAIPMRYPALEMMTSPLSINNKPTLTSTDPFLEKNSRMPQPDDGNKIIQASGNYNKLNASR